MAKSTAPVLIAGGVSFFNGWFGTGIPDLKVLAATGIAAAGLALLEQVPGMGGFAAGVAWIAVITVFLIPPRRGPSPADNLMKITGM